MTDVSEFIESGILETYVLGNTTAEETAQVVAMMAQHEVVRQEVEAIGIALEEYGMANAIEPDPAVRLMLMATIDYTERLKAGEVPSFPPEIHAGSQIEDYAPWLQRKDLEPAWPVEDAHATIIGYTPQIATSIVWLRYGAPPETHTNEFEKFLIVEGTCDITVGDQVHSMKPGDALIIPLFVSHHVVVTSQQLCKIILQRVAA
jgi:mannose-6-phosphate isomerase-like protein (cupin superfamily)